MSGCDTNLVTRDDLYKAKRQTQFIADVGTGGPTETVTNPDTGVVVPTLQKVLADLGWTHTTPWDTNPLVTEALQVIPYNNQLFLPNTLPYQVDSATHPDPNALVPSELRDVSSFLTKEDLSDYRKNYGTVSSMIQDVELKEGDNVYLSGFYTETDYGSGAMYSIQRVSSSYHQVLNNGLVAVLIPQAVVNFGWFGITGSGDETSKVLSAIAFAEENPSCWMKGISGITVSIRCTQDWQYPTAIIASKSSNIYWNGMVLQLAATASNEYSIVAFTGSEPINWFDPIVIGDTDIHDWDNHPGEHGHGFHYCGASNVTLYNPRADKCIGDGFYVGHDKDDNTLATGRDGKCYVYGTAKSDGCNRQGLATTCCEGFSCEHFHFTNVNQHPKYPQATQWNGVDFEPNNENQPLKGIWFGRITGDVAKYGVSLYIQNWGKTGTTVLNQLDITIDSIDIDNCYNSLDITHSPLGAEARGKFRVGSLVSKNSRFNGYRVTDWTEKSPMLSIETSEVDYNNVTLSDNADSGSCVNVRSLEGGGNALPLDNIYIGVINQRSKRAGAQSPVCCVNNSNVGGVAARANNLYIGIGQYIDLPVQQGISGYDFKIKKPVNLSVLQGYTVSGDLKPVAPIVEVTVAATYDIPKLSYGFKWKFIVSNGNRFTLTLGSGVNFKPASLGFSQTINTDDGYGASIELTKWFSNTAYIDNVVGTWNAQ